METGRWGLTIFLALVGVFAVLLLAADRPPRMPEDANHRLDQAEASCLTCHGYGKKHPRPESHPLRDDCFSCHRDARGKLHPRREAPIALPGGWQEDPRLSGRAKSSQLRPPSPPAL